MPTSEPCGLFQGEKTKLSAVSFCNTLFPCLTFRSGKYGEKIYTALQKRVFRGKNPAAFEVLTLHENNFKRKSCETRSKFSSAGMKAISRNWLDTDPPRHRQWFNIAHEIFGMETMTYSLRVNEDENRKWEKWIRFRNEDIGTV